MGGSVAPQMLVHSMLNSNDSSIYRDPLAGIRGESVRNRKILIVLMPEQQAVLRVTQRCHLDASTGAVAARAEFGRFPFVLHTIYLLYFHSTERVLLPRVVFFLR